MERLPLLAPVIGSLGTSDLSAKLREMGAADDADALSSPPGGQRARAILDKPWRYIAHKFGYFAPGEGPRPIQGAGGGEADQSLLGARIVVRLDRLYVEDYPGYGEHAVLLTFKGLNQTDSALEPASFSRTYRAHDKESVATKGQPIFVGLTVGPQGVGFECATVNVKSKGDEQILACLGSSSLNTGLQLLTAAQPLLKPFTEMTLGVAKALCTRSSNAAVQDFYLGLDFDEAGGGARLRLGSYVAMQVPDDNTINWNEWVYDLEQQAIVGKDDPTLRPYYNHIIFRISRFER